MQWLKAGGLELYRLFVDDGAFATVICAWLAFSCAVLPSIDIPTDWKGALLAAGLFAILIESVARRSKH